MGSEMCIRDRLISGQKLGTPEPLFHKLDEDLVQHEAKKMDRS